MNERRKTFLKAIGNKKASDTQDAPYRFLLKFFHKQAEDQKTSSQQVILRLDQLCTLVGAQNYNQLAEKLTAVAELKSEVEQLNTLIAKLPTEHKITNLKDLGKYLKTEVNIIDDRKLFSQISKQLEDIDNKLSPKQSATEFIPIRRVRKINNRLQFDDSDWTGGPSGGGGADPVGIKDSDGTQAAVNQRSDGINALEVSDDMTSGETFRQALVASTDTTITFTQPVRLVRVKNESTTSVIFVRDGEISSDTPANAEIVGVAPASNVPNTEYYPFKTTTVHLRSAGTPTVNVTGFY